MATKPARKRSSLGYEHPAYPSTPQPAAVAVPTEVPTPTASPDATPPPPRRRKAPAKVQLNTRVPAELHERLAGFVDAHDSTVQDVVEAALTEYLDRR